MLQGFSKLDILVQEEQFPPPPPPLAPCMLQTSSFILLSAAPGPKLFTLRTQRYKWTAPRRRRSRTRKGEVIKRSRFFFFFFNVNKGIKAVYVILNYSILWHSSSRLRASDRKEPTHAQFNSNLHNGTGQDTIGQRELRALSNWYS